MEGRDSYRVRCTKLRAIRLIGSYQKFNTYNQNSYLYVLFIDTISVYFVIVFYKRVEPFFYKNTKKPI